MELFHCQKAGEVVWQIKMDLMLQKKKWSASGPDVVVMSPVSVRDGEYVFKLNVYLYKTSGIKSLLGRCGQCFAWKDRENQIDF